MSPHSSGISRAAAGLMLFCLLDSINPIAHAQVPPPDRGFVRKHAFDMPFTVDPDKRGGIRELKLYVRPEPGRDWELQATATPAKTTYHAPSRLYVGNFDIRVERDGTYAIAMMTVFTDGTSLPRTVDELQAEQKVVVDTRPPTINLKAITPQTKPNGQIIVGIEWKAEDEFLLRDSVRLEGRYFGSTQWGNLSRAAAAEEEGKQAWTIEPTRRLEVQITASDRAGNLSRRSLVLTASGSTSTGPGSLTANGSSTQPNYRLVNSKTVKLSYRVRERPPSGLDKIDLWVTRVGNDWKKYEKSNPAPAEESDSAEVSFDATTDGTYGFTMVATSKAGIAQATPKSNDAPQIWVEIDTTPPEATLRTVKLADPADGRSLLLEWKAEDKNLESMPIIFEYAEVDSKNVVGKWQELTTPLPNSGKYICPTPQLSAGSYLFKVRMNVFDKAHNHKTVDHPTTISSDVAKPRVEITEVKTDPTESKKP